MNRRLLTLLAAAAFAACDVPPLKLDKKTERELTKAGKATAKAANKASKEIGKLAKEVAKEVAKEAQKPQPEEANIPGTALTDRGEVPLACRAVDAAGNPLAVADDNRWRANARCR